MKPQERNEIAKHRKLEAIDTELAQHSRKVNVTVILVAVLDVVLLAVLAYQFLFHT